MTRFTPGNKSASRESAAEESGAVPPNGEMAVPLMELRDICRTFVTDGGVEVRALRNVNFKIYPGEFVAIVGQSGSGKSTLMNILGCLDRPTSGTYMVAGQNIQSFDTDGLAWLRREAFGFVFQSYHLLASETAAENVEVPGIYAGKSVDERAMRAESLLTSLGLGDRLDHRPNQLSGGQQQRVSIARALMNGGNIILADEPTGALDSDSGVEVMGLLNELATQGHTVIIITHDSAVADHADRIIQFKDGQVVSDSGPKEGTVDPGNNAKLKELFSGRNSSRVFVGAGESVRMALRSLRANLFRTTLTLLGIVIGVASVVAMLAIGQGAQQDIIARISAIGTNILAVRFDPAEGRWWNYPSTLSFQDAEAIANTLPNVAYTLPELQGQYTVQFGSQATRPQVSAITAGMPEARHWPLASGVFFTEEAGNNHAAVAVLGSTVVQDLFPAGRNPIGQYILIKKVPFQVIGVMTRKGGSGRNNPDDQVYVPFKTGALRLFGKDNPRSITVAVENIKLIDSTEDHIAQLMLRRHGVKDFRIFNSAQLLQTVKESQATFTLLLGSIGAISLLVGGIGVMNIMLVSVTERTREIGVRMATGARKSDILSQFISEAVVVSALGGLVGIGFGVGAGALMRLFGINAVFSSGPMILAFSCAAATGLVFGFAPAHKAAGLDPVVALANE